MTKSDGWAHPLRSSWLHTISESSLLSHRPTSLICKGKGSAQLVCGHQAEAA